MSRCKKLFLLSIIGSAAITMACGSGSYHDKIPTDLKITNGIAIAETEYPATIMLIRRYPQSSDQSEFLCSATFISDQDALTAAHCLEPYQGYAPTLVYVEFTTDPTPATKSGVIRPSPYRPANTPATTATNRDPTIWQW